MKANVLALVIIAVIFGLAVSGALGQEVPPLVRTVGGADSAMSFYDLGGVHKDSIIYVFPRLTSKGYPVIDGKVSLFFYAIDMKAGADTTVSDSLNVWMKTLRRLTGSTYTICENDSITCFPWLNWNPSGAYYCWPNQNTTVEPYGPCDGLVFYWQYNSGTAGDSMKVTPYITIQ